MNVECHRRTGLLPLRLRVYIGFFSEYLSHPPDYVTMVFQGQYIRHFGSSKNHKMNHRSVMVYLVGYATDMKIFQSHYRFRHQAESRKKQTWYWFAYIESNDLYTKKIEAMATHCAFQRRAFWRAPNFTACKTHLRFYLKILIQFLFSVLWANKLFESFKIEISIRFLFCPFRFKTKSKVTCIQMLIESFYILKRLVTILASSSFAITMSSIEIQIE